MMKLGQDILHKNQQAEEDKIYSLIRKIPQPKSKGETFIGELHFDIESKGIKVNSIPYSPSNGEMAAKKYLWIGNSKSNSPQWQATTDNLQYLLSQSIPELLKLAQNQDNPDLKNLLSPLKDKGLLFDLNKFEEWEIKNERFRYVIDLEKFGIFKPGEITELQNKAITEKKQEDFIKEFTKLFLQRFNISQSTVVLWSIFVDNLQITDTDTYKKIIRQQMRLGSNFVGEKGICSCCSEETSVTSDTSKMDFKYYNTDKLAFSSQLQKERFNKNFVLCGECIEKVLAAERFVSDTLKTRLGDFSLYVIPDFVGDINLTKGNLGDLSKILSDSVGIMANFSKVKELENKLESLTHLGENRISYFVNLLFYERNNSEFKIVELITDVPDTRFDLLAKAFNEIAKISDRIFGSVSNYYNFVINLNTFYRLTICDNLKKSSKKKSLELVSTLIVGGIISYKKLITSYVTYIRDQFIGGASSAEKERNKLYNDILKMNLSLYLVRYLNQLSEDRYLDSMEEIALENEQKKDLNDEEHDVGASFKHPELFVRKMGYNEAQEGLFWLGNLVGYVASSQWINGLKSYPILDKINYRGMGVRSIQKFSTEVIESLKQYKRLSQKQVAEALFNMHRLLDRNIVANNWRLSEEEATFYILSGFSYQQYFVRQKEKEDEDEENGSELK